MLNCVGSYFYSIVNHLSQNGNGHAMLYYLCIGHLTYRNLHIENVLKKYNENPWGYQPIVILDSQGRTLEIDETFFDYLLKNHHVDVECLDMNKKDLISCLKQKENQTVFTICNVDEYYMPYSQFYQKSHNKHFVLIKEIVFKNSLLEIIDSEKNHTYQMTFDDMEQAVYKSIYKRKILYQIDGSHYENKLDTKKLIYNLLPLDHVYLQELMKDAETKLLYSSDRQEYYFKGYYYTIMSKIIPYYKMLTCLLLDNNSKYYRSYLDLVSEWKNLSKYMRLKIYRGENGYTKFMKNLDIIYCKENTIDFDL